jgi:peptide/nickel transport system substrate-binding protein
MNRRGPLAGGAASALGRPALAGKTQTLVCVPQNALNSIDPIWTTAQIARNMGFMVFDMLYDRDENNVPRPQMIESGVADDGSAWRDNLRGVFKGPSIVFWNVSKN